MIELNAIHLSQMPELWQTNVTYQNDLMYEHIELPPNYQDCMEYLNRKIKQLDAKIAKGGYTRHMSRWQNQREMYASILKYLSLRKQV
jgi:hypothetical protein